MVVEFGRKAGEALRLPNKTLQKFYNCSLFITGRVAQLYVSWLGPREVDPKSLLVKTTSDHKVQQKTSLPVLLNGQFGTGFIHWGPTLSIGCTTVRQNDCRHSNKPNVKQRTILLSRIGTGMLSPKHAGQATFSLGHMLLLLQWSSHRQNNYINKFWFLEIHW